jgi:ammonium transporter, Amt family
MALCNGVLCGLVAVTPGCGVIDVWAAIIVAVLGAGLFLLLDWLMLRRGGGVWVAGRLLGAGKGR